ncbi:amidase family protein [Onishia taeanensis]|uniref:amidase family protein n=1 Tax=Onishia taeanensis TaxID=284577 RepID=UPI003C7AC740
MGHISVEISRPPGSVLSANQHFNPIYGATRTPYDLTHAADSGGAATALDARLIPIADGSDMMGSPRNPAALCNIYG